MKKRKLISLLMSLSLAASAFAASPAFAEEAASGTAETLSQSQLLPRGAWSVKASHKESDIAKIWDDDTETRWTSHTNQAGDEYIIIDLGAQYNVDKIELLSNDGDYARGYKVYVSNNGTVFGDPVAQGTGTDADKPTQTISFSAVDARYIKIEQTGKVDTTLWWSIDELYVYGTATEGSMTPAISTDAGNIVKEFHGSSNKVTVAEGTDGTYNYYSMTYNDGAPNYDSMAANLEDVNRVPGAVYSYSMMIYNPNDTAQSYKVKLAGARRLYTDASLAENVSAGNWQKCTGQLTLPKDNDITESTLQFQIYSDKTASFYVSDVYLSEPVMPASINPYETVQAGSFSEKNGDLKIEDSTRIGSIKNGHWVKFYNVDFGTKGASKFDANLATDGTVDANVELYLDDINSTCVGKLNFKGSGGWQDWKTVSGDVNIPGGTHDLYMKFTGTGTEGYGYLFNMKDWKFTEKQEAEVPVTTFGYKAEYVHTPAGDETNGLTGTSSMRFIASASNDENKAYDACGFWLVNLGNFTNTVSSVEQNSELKSGDSFYTTINDFNVENANKMGIYAIPWVKADTEVITGKVFTYGGDLKATEVTNSVSYGE